MSQRARALVDRLKRETAHERLPSTNPAVNKALGTICMILDELAPAAEPAAAAPSEPEPAGQDDPGQNETGDPGAAEEPAEGDEGGDPAVSGMTTRNSPV